MDNGARPRRTSARATLGLISALVVFVALPQAAAQARTVVTDHSRISPVTWVDDAGRQYLVTEVLVDFGPTYQLVVARNTPGGGPDPAWGSYQHPTHTSATPGLRALDLPAPAEGFVMEHVIAATDSGTLTTTWREPTCDDLAACGRWMARFDATGTAVAPPVNIGVSAQPDQPHRDGSLTTTDAAGQLGWRAPDGSDRGAPALASAEVQDLTVDRAGRLLVTGTNGTLTRWPVGGPADLVMPVTTCAAGAPVFVAAAEADDGFATICGRTGERSLEVERRTADGTITWRTAAPQLQPDGAIRTPTASTLDGNDRVWLGGSGERAIAPGAAASVFVQSFTEAGPEALAYWRDSPNFTSYEYGSFKVSDVRGTSGGGVAVADDKRCCRGAGFVSASGRAYAEVVTPIAVQPPTCAATELDVTAASASMLEISFDRCVASGIPRDRQPLEYEISVTAPGTTPHSTAVPIVLSSRSVRATVGVTTGVLSTVSVRPRNQAGDGPAISTDTVAPFSSVEGFVTRQHEDVNDSVPPGEPATSAGRLRAGEDPATWLAGLLEEGLAGQHAEPLARLYRTYFQRDPDPSGFDYWIRRRLNGARLAHTSDTFAASSEFRRTYGPLTNREFVAALYRNAFGREADTGGLNFWTGRIDRGRNSRGQVVLQFSESSEGKRRTASIVEPIGASWYLLGRLPTAAERAAWLDFEEPRRQSAAAILATAEYANRVNG